MPTSSLCEEDANKANQTSLKEPKVFNLKIYLYLREKTVQIGFGSKQRQKKTSNQHKRPLKQAT